MKIKLFTDSDLDGVGCVILANIAYGKKNVDVEYCNPYTINEKISEFIEKEEYKEYDYVYITDLSISLEIADIINTLNPPNFASGFCLGEMVQLLDHHKSAKGLNKYFFCYVKEYNDEIKLDFETSGSYMFYEHLINIEDLKPNGYLYNFIDLIRQYDTWEWKDNENLLAKELNDLFHIIGIKEFADSYTNKLICDNNPSLFSKRDRMLLKLEQDKIDKYIYNKNKTLRKIKINEHLVGVVFAEHYVSELGNQLNILNADLNYVAIINMDRSVSFRTTKDNIDLSIIAKSFGGGGHPKAAGCDLSEDLIQSFINKLFKKDGDK